MGVSKRNKEHPDDDPQWRDIPVVLVGSHNGSVTDIIPYYDAFTNEDLVKVMTETFALRGTVFDLYLNGYFYSLELDQKGHDRVRQAAVVDGNTVETTFHEVMAERISYCRDMHLAFYFPDEDPVDSEPGF